MEFIGLPVHPLVVHAAVILVPLAALGALLVVGLPSARLRYGWLTAGFAAAAAVSAIAARFSGEWFVDGLGLRGAPLVESHMRWGLWAPWPALLLAVAVPLFLLTAPGRNGRGGGAAFVVAGVVVVLAALASLVLIGLTGHSGATAVWGS